MIQMPLTYDQLADAAFFEVSSYQGNRSRITDRVIELELGTVIVNVRDDGGIIGFEILGASKLLPEQMLDAADAIT